MILYAHNIFTGRYRQAFLMDIRHIREDYTLHGLHEDELNPNPFEQFKQWYQQAEATKQPVPNAVSLATADKNGMPSVRTVLLKVANEDGFVFYTNYTSRKAKDIAENPHAALLFFWPHFERQVIINGEVEKISPEESALYFHSRPYTSQIGALCSRQSSVLKSREELEHAFEDLKICYRKGDVPYPEFWGGYKVKAMSIEFWQGRVSRLHDRLRYKFSENKTWVAERLAP